MVMAPVQRPSTAACPQGAEGQRERAGSRSFMGSMAVSFVLIHLTGAKRWRCCRDDGRRMRYSRCGRKDDEDDG